MRITHLPNLKDCISAETVYPFYTVALMLDYIFQKVCTLSVLPLAHLNIMFVTVLLSISEK